MIDNKAICVLKRDIQAGGGHPLYDLHRFIPVWADPIVIKRDLPICFFFHLGAACRVTCKKLKQFNDIGIVSWPVRLIGMIPGPIGTHHDIFWHRLSE